MCRARFESQHQRPEITATLVFPRIEIGHEINFIVDTGAGGTCVTEADSVRGGLHPLFLPDDVQITQTESEGVGGTSVDFWINEPAWLAFEEFNEERERHSLHIEYLPGMRISTGSPENLLGRDIIHKFRMEYDPIDGVIEMERDNFGGGRYQCFNADEELSPGLRSFGDDQEE